MEFAPVAGISMAVVALLGRLLPVRLVGGRARAVLLRDIELYEKLPTDSQARDTLRKHIDASVVQLTEDESTKRRDPLGIGLATFFLAAGAVLAYVAVQAKSWQWTWGTGAFLCLLFGVVGMAQDASKQERDERGRPIKSGDKSR